MPNDQIATTGWLALFTALPLTALAGGRVELSAGTDSNISRAEVPADQRQASAGQVVVELQGAARPSRRISLRARYHAGARIFDGQSGEDTLYQVIRGRATTRLIDGLLLDLQLSARDRQTRDPLHPRDLTQVVGGPGLIGRLGPLTATVHAEISRLDYAPNPTQSADGLGLRGALSLRFGALTTQINGRLTQRDADGGWRDRIRSVSGGVSYSGRWLMSANYTLLTADFENEDTPGLFRHRVSVSGTVSLPWSIVASARVDLQRDLLDSPILLETGEISDEGRSSVTARLERPITDEVSLLVTGGAWFSPFDTGTGYDRRLVLAGLGWRSP